ncbi:hypothetical protein [Methylobacterium fujisawaense]
MTSEGPAPGGDPIQAAATTNLLTLAVSLETLKRLLDRRAEDGALLQAEPALIQVAITAGRETLRGVNEKLTKVLADPTSHDRPAAALMAEMVAELGNLLATIEGALHRLDE